MIEIELTVGQPAGLHARPAAQLVRAAAGFVCRLTIANPGRDPERYVDARSLIGLLTLGLRAGQPLRLRADGPDEAAAVAAVRAIIGDDGQPAMAQPEAD
jgi:phosphocarrier protein